MKSFDRWKSWARLLKVEAYTLYWACKDSRVPWHAKAFAALVAGYVFSPIDLIPDPIPVLGYLDDLVLVPLGVLLARRMIPAPVLEECRERARVTVDQGKPRNRTAVVVMVALWMLAVAALILFIVRRARTSL